MKSTIKTSRTAGQLEKMFRELNKHYYNGELPEPIITLKKTPSAYGHITTVKTWTVSTEQRYEINISTATLDRPIENTTATLLHEMAHLYNLVHGIRDTSSQSGAYHNKRFKATAEAHGLVIDHHEKYGWTITSPSEELLDFIIFMGWQDIQMTEGLTWADMCGTGTASKGPGSSQTGAPKPPKAKSSTRRWVCPKCGTIIRSNKENLDTGTPTGELMLTMIAAINEFERQNLLDRQREGIAIAKRNGIYKGRKKVTTPDDFSELYARYTRREMNKGQLAEALHVTRPTLERIIREHLAAAAQIWKSDKLFCHELVSHASDCAQIKRLVGVILNFRAQAADMYHNGVVVYHIVAPDAAVDLLFGQHLVLVGEEILHQEALLAGKRDFGAFFQ